MKKVIGLLLAAVLAVMCAGACAEPETLTVEELSAFCGQLLEAALKEEPVTPEEDEDGFYRFDYGAYTLVGAEKELTAESEIVRAELVAFGAEPMADMRGIGPGSSLETLLAAYPLDNTNLAGTYEEAAMYISGLLPATVNTGMAYRIGSHVLVAEHDVYTTEGETAWLSYVSYTLENNAVVSVQIALNATEMTLEEAQGQIDRLSALQEAAAYTVYRAEEPTPLAREDLTFGPVDFISAAPENLTDFLGLAESDTWETDDAGFLRILQWDGVQAIFRYDGQKENGSLRLLQIYGEQMEGPRSLHMEDSLESVQARFPEESGTLYGGEEPGGETTLTYETEVEGETVLLEMNFEGGRLYLITCTYR